MSFLETMELSRFAVGQQEEIAKSIFEKYNTSHDEGILAAIRDAVWQGFCSGLDAGKNLAINSENRNRNSSKESLS